MRKTINHLTFLSKQTKTVNALSKVKGEGKISAYSHHSHDIQTKNKRKPILKQVITSKNYEEFFEMKGLCF